MDSKEKSFYKVEIQNEKIAKELKEAPLTIPNSEAFCSTVDEYMLRLDWRVKENANEAYSLQGLRNYVSGKVCAVYWLNKVYPKEAALAHYSGWIHIHDLGVLGPYCTGWDIEDFLRRGFGGIPGKIKSRPPKHFRVALLQLCNFLYTLAGEVAGACAVSNFDTYLAPFIRYDNLSYREVKQALEEFIYNMNVPTRVGFQSPFTNVTLDVVVPEDLRDKHVIIGGKEMPETYEDFEDEMYIFNKAFLEVLLEGDALGRPFPFPIPTYNITRDWDWDSEITDLLMEAAAKYGYPYFANFVNSHLKPEDVRSMCCRLRLDTREIKKGGLYAPFPLTGSVGVVTINMPRIGYLAKDDDEFFEMLEDLMNVAKAALMAKRYFVEKYTEEGLYPYCKLLLYRVKALTGEYWRNHFNTIGLVGMNEALLNFMGEGIWTDEGKRFAEKVLDFMVEKSLEFQEETGYLFNIEATPAESTCYRLARIDKKKYPDIIVANEKDYREKGEAPYYTNSTNLPVDYTDDLFFVLKHQESLQSKYTGGTVLHIWLSESPDPQALKRLLKKMIYGFRIPYYCITPTFSICPVHGYIPGVHFTCPYPHTEEELKAAGLL